MLRVCEKRLLGSQRSEAKGMMPSMRGRRAGLRERKKGREESTVKQR